MTPHNARIEVLKRWWYCFGEWPPADYDYEAQLRRYKLRQVEWVQFKREPELDVDGSRKVYQIDGYPGVFRTSSVRSLRAYTRETHSTSAPRRLAPRSTTSSSFPPSNYPNSITKVAVLLFPTPKASKLSSMTCANMNPTTRSSRRNLR